MLSTNSRRSGSPARLTIRIELGARPVSIRVFMADGTVLISVASIGEFPSSRAFLAILVRAPVVRGTKHSKTARSKLSEVEKSVRSNISGAKAELLQERKLTALR